jgi:release factor glutamine methyltransferase
MTIAQARQAARAQLAPITPTFALDADVLLAHVLGWPRVRLFAHDGQPLTPEQAEQYQSLIRRRAAGQPVAYLTGHKEWFGLDLLVSPAVLIPRPETELVAERAIAVAQETSAHTIADVGTGSGALAIALARALPTARVYAVDISAEALAVAAENVRRHVTSGEIRLLQGDLLEPLFEKPDLVVANLPYLGEHDMCQLAPEVLAEPRTALQAGETGLELFQRLFFQTHECGWSPNFVLEIDPRQREAISALVRAYYPHAIVVIEQDLAGLDRIVTVRNR